MKKDTKEKRVMILTDLEGCSGTEGYEDSGIGNKVFNGGTSVQCLANEINACAEGLLEGGATSILVWDCHGGGRNVPHDLLLDGIEMCMTNEATCHMAFLDHSFCATVQIGAHAKQGTLDGYLNHTRNSHGAALTALNGKPIGEPEFGIFRAAYFKVPTLLVAGDYAACRDALAFQGKPLETVVCKRGFSRYSVMHYPPEKVLSEIREKSKRAMQNLASYKVLEFPGEQEMIYRAMCPNQVRHWVMRGAEMLDDTTVRLYGNPMDLFAQLCGWAPGVHNRTFSITPETDDLF